MLSLHDLLLLLFLVPKMNVKKVQRKIRTHKVPMAHHLDFACYMPEVGGGRNSDTDPTKLPEARLDFVS